MPNFPAIDIHCVKLRTLNRDSKETTVNITNVEYHICMYIEAGSSKVPAKVSRRQEQTYRNQDP